MNLGAAIMLLLKLFISVRITALRKLNTVDYFDILANTVRNGNCIAPDLICALVPSFEL